MTRPPPAGTAELIRTLFEATAPATGERFFNALARHLATALDVRISMASELVKKGKTARTLALWANGRFVDNMEYLLRGTPCERVLEGKIVQINENVHIQYPSAA